MAKAAKAQTKIIEKKKIEQILITQPKPESEKSPYFELARKYGVQLDFFPFIRVEGLSAKEFRKQKLNLSDFTGVILVSRNAVDHFFRICEEIKFKVSQDMKYFCASEAVALYLQKFILYRKRKVFFSPDGSSEGLVEVLQKYREKENFIFPVSEHTKNDVSPLLIEAGFTFSEAVLYRTVSNEVKDILKNKYDVIVFFSPFSVETLMNNKPRFKQADTLIGAFGNTTSKAVEDSGLKLSIKAPMPNMPSMVAALDHFLCEESK
ncbi:MAG TPA: uroporphyrinogen-III synthase [Edaphocola sp.]|nr:uroporphyrinogen-III synthase [Edaphocola sp.]